jgi:photosynthetic reaction center H subunit
MGTGALTQYVDVAQLVLYIFWLFFAGLIYYLVRENHREGYPMEAVDGRGTVTGWPIPAQKTYKLAHGEDVMTPSYKVSSQPLLAEPSHGWTGAPLIPTGNPMLDGVGPGAWSDRADEPDTSFDGQVKIVPLRKLTEFDVSPNDNDPRGLPVIGADGEVGGKVVDLWLDQSETIFRYIEVEVEGTARHVLLPINFARIRRDEVKVGAILGSQFADVPGTRLPDQVTLLEEDKIMGYYGGGTLYAEPSRAEPLV